MSWLPRLTRELRGTLLTTAPSGAPVAVSALVPPRVSFWAREELLDWCVWTHADVPDVPDGWRPF